MTLELLTLSGLMIDAPSGDGMRRSLGFVVLNDDPKTDIAAHRVPLPAGADVSFTLLSTLPDPSRPPPIVRLHITGLLPEGDPMGCVVRLRRSREDVPPNCDVEVSVALTASEECRLNSVAARCASHMDECVARCLAGGFGRGYVGGCLHNCDAFHGYWDAEPPGWFACGPG